jgi:signal transduction histidine kinase
MRLARCLRKQQMLQSALAVYGELTDMGGTIVAGSPSELVGRRERIMLLRTAGDVENSRREEALLASALFEGRFMIDRSTFDFFRDALPSEGTAADAAFTESSHIADAVAGLWATWHEQPAGRAIWVRNREAQVAVWRRTANRTAVIIGDIAHLMTSATVVADKTQVRFALDDPAGRKVWGDVPAGRRSVTRTTRETGLPWTIHLAPTDPVAAQVIVTSRRNLFAAGFGLMVLTITAASYFVFRSVNSELGVARLQSDFVDAVSHEFRTPLTAMCHITEVLEDGGAPSGRLPEYYRALATESRRLKGMVESLLDFGRLEAGRQPYDFVETDAAQFVTEIVHDLRERVPSAAHRLQLLELPCEAPGRFCIRADRHALALALRNLVDNALKYSPGATAVKVSVQPAGAFVGIAVEDAGPGVSRDEQRDVFRKFARGSAARTLNVQGTGIGLAMAEQIVKAHGGRLELVSEPGRGSRFTTFLPVQPGPA